MTVNETLAQASNAMVYGSMTAFTGAMVAFSVSLAKGRRIETIEVSAQRTSASHQVRKGSTATLDEPSVSTSVSDGVDLGEGRRAGNIGMSLTWLGTLLLGLGILFRGLSAGRVPIGNMYEFSLAAGFAVSLTYCLMSISRDLRWLGLFISIPVLLDLGLALTVLYTESAQLVPALNSYWLAIHVSAAVVCIGAFTMGAALSGLYLVAQAAEDRVATGKEPGRSSAFAQRIPSADRLDLMSYRIHAFMFPIWTFAVIAGAIGLRHDSLQLLCCEHFRPRPAFILWPVSNSYRLGERSRKKLGSSSGANTSSSPRPQPRPFVRPNKIHSSGPITGIRTIIASHTNFGSAFGFGVCKQSARA